MLTKNLPKISNFLFGHPTSDKLSGLALTILFAVLGVNAVFLGQAAFRGFYFLDYGGFLDATWRVYRGQKPYIDFIYTVGPVHLYMSVFFYYLFGFGKLAILTHIITVSSIVIFATMEIARKHTPFFFSLLAMLLSCVGFYWWFPHPWYDHSAFFWIILSIWLIHENDFSKISSKRRDLVLLACGALTLLSVMTKTNVGAIYAIICFLYFLSYRNLKIVLWYLFGILLSLVLIFLLVQSPKNLIDNVFLNFGMVSANRFERFKDIRTLFKSFYWVPTLVIFLNLPYLYKNALRPVLFLFGIILTAIFCLNTGSLRVAANITLFGIIIAISFKLLYTQREHYKVPFDKAIYIISISALVIISLWQIYFVTDYSVARNSGKYTFNPISDYRIKSHPLQGWVLSFPNDSIVDDMADFIKNNIPKDDSLLILTDMQILYALTNRDSYRGVPFMFFLGTVPSPGKQVEIVKANITRNLPDWILTHRDSDFPLINKIWVYLQLEPELLSRYRLIETWGQYGLLKKIS